MRKTTKMFKTRDGDTLVFVGDAGVTGVFVSDGYGGWNWFDSSTDTWSDEHQAAYRNQRYSTVATLPPGFAALPPIPERTALAPEMPHNTHPSLAAWVARGPSGRRKVVILLGEDGYETMFGDGKVAYLQACLPSRDAMAAYKAEHGDWSHERELTLRADAGHVVEVHAEREWFDRWKLAAALDDLAGRVCSTEVGEVFDLGTLLRRHEEDDDHDAVVTAVRAAGSTGLKAVLRALFGKDAFHGHDTIVPDPSCTNALLVNVLGELGDERSVPFLGFLLHGVAGAAELEGAAAEALEAIGSEKAILQLIDAWPDTSAIGDDSTDYASVLERLDSRAIAILISCMKERFSGSGAMLPEYVELLMGLIQTTGAAPEEAVSILQQIGLGDLPLGERRRGGGEVTMSIVQDFLGDQELHGTG
jgi:hypothetical protein